MQPSDAVPSPPPPPLSYVLFSVTVNAFIYSAVVASGRVMKARKNLDVQYPNLYATPGHHKHADAFNRVQRGHQALFEQLPFLQLSSLVGGLQYPLANAVGFNLFLLGSHLYQIGYEDMKLDVKTARYGKGGWIKYFGILACLGTAGKVSLGMTGLFGK